MLKMNAAKKFIVQDFDWMLKHNFFPPIFVGMGFHFVEFFKVVKKNSVILHTALLQLILDSTIVKINILPFALSQF